MLVYKFGGASIANADLIRNMCDIVAQCDDKLIIVLSALGKTTNALEQIVASKVISDRSTASEKLEQLLAKHNDIADELGINKHCLKDIEEQLYEQLLGISNNTPLSNYDYWYDNIVSYGEMLSSTLVCEYMKQRGFGCKLLDAKDIIITDSKHREANIDMEKSQLAFSGYTSQFPNTKVFITQGFIAANEQGEATTLGREGSDYSAAVFSVLSGAKKLTIWKDVKGVLNADPRAFSNTKLIEHLNYYDAVELSYSGAQIIHPKTIRPLKINNIELIVRSFIDTSSCGSTINAHASSIDIPIIILKTNLTLLTIAPKDFSFVIEESLEEVFTLANKHRQKVILVQNSAVRISIAVEDSRYFNAFLTELSSLYKVAYNEGLELLTVRGDMSQKETKELINKERDGYKIYLSQGTRRLKRLLRKKL